MLRFYAVITIVKNLQIDCVVLEKKVSGAFFLAIYAYYFLVMTVVLQIAEYRREGKGLRVKARDDKNGGNKKRKRALGTFFKNKKWKNWF